MRLFALPLSAGLVAVVTLGPQHARAQPRDVYGAVRRPSSDVIHDQTLKQGVQQRQNAPRWGSSYSPSPSPTEDPPVCVSSYDQARACADLTDIAKFRSRWANQAEIVARILLNGGPRGRCFDKSDGFEGRLAAWGRACGLAAADLQVLRDPEAAAQARARARVVIGSPTPRPSVPSTPRPSEPSPPKPAVITPPSPTPPPPPRRSPPPVDSKALALRERRERQLGEYEAALRRQDERWLARLSVDLANAPSKIGQYSKWIKLTPEVAIAECTRGKEASCTAAKAMARTRAEALAAYEADCTRDLWSCADAEQVARAIGDWTAHRRVVERRCQGSFSEPCAILAKFHLESPAWRSQWQWPKTRLSKEQGRKAADVACTFQGAMSLEVACGELVRAAKHGLGGPIGFTASEFVTIEKQCREGYMSARDCEDAYAIPSLARR